MKWIHRLKADVDNKVQSKGDGYFRTSAVEIGFGNHQEVKATVAGTQDYAVEIRLDGNAVIVFCDCPHFTDGAICKHIWATLLAAEAQGHLSNIAATAHPYVEHGLNDDGIDDLDLADDDDFVLVPPPQHDRNPAPKPPPIEPWKTHLSALRGIAATKTAGAGDPSRKILYVVDIAESVSSGTLVLSTAVCRRKKNGEWGNANFQDYWIRDIPMLEPADRRILSLLSGTLNSTYANTGTVPTRYRPSPAAFDVLFPLMCATGRFFVRAHSAAELQPLAWDDGAPWTFRVNVKVEPETSAYALTGMLKRGDDERPLSDAVLLVPGLAFFSDRVSRFDDTGKFEWVTTLRRERKLTVPAKQRVEFVNELIQFPGLPQMDLPEDVRVEEATPSGAPDLKIRPTKQSWTNQQKLECEITFDYNGMKVAEADPAWAIHDNTRDRFIRRDRAAETRAVQYAVDLGMRHSLWSRQAWEVSAKQMPNFVRTLVADGWHVEAEGRLYRRPGGLKVDVASGIDWFELRGGADFEGQTASLPELLKAVARGDHMVRLDDGSFGIVPEDWLQRYRLVAGLGKAEGDGVRFTRGQAGLLDALLANLPEVTFDEGFKRVRQELESFSGVQARDPASTFKGKLRDYQRDGLGWLCFLRRFGFGGCLADDMGLGKTIQVLALLDSPERKGPALVVVPRSLVFNWQQEAARFAPNLRVLDFTGAGRKERWQDLHGHDLILTTYGTMLRDVPQLKDIRFDTIVLDEAQTIKNAATESAKAARLLNAEHRLALTGTPVENRLSDLWSLFEFLNPGLLGNASIFRTQTSGTFSEEPAQILSKALRPFILRRTKEQVAKELPPKTEQTIYCELESKQRRLYDELRDHYRDALLGRIDDLGIRKSKMQILEALLRLRQAACHPGLIDKTRTGESSAKLDALIPQLQEVMEEGHKALVFSQFTSLLGIVRSRLDEQKINYEYLDGRTRDREARVKRFQEDPACMLFLISLKAGGLGLNLTAAEYVFLLDPWWNPAAEAQAIDRSHRIGQARHVFAYRLIARDTVEEKVLELQKSKRALASAIINADNSALGTLDRDTLEVLLS